MPMSAAELEDLKNKLAASRQKELNFGLSFASKPEQSAMLIHRTLKPEKLEKDAKKIAGSPKVACGTVKCKGKLVMLTCFNAPPSTAAKRLKAFLKFATGDSMKIQIMDSGGNVLESEDDGEQNEAPGAPSVAAKTPDPATPDDKVAKKLNAILKKLTPKIKAAVIKNPRARDPIRKLLQAIKTAGTDGDAASGKKRLIQLGKVLARVGAD
ncbi:MAG: hypothetical protein L3J36_14330 [Rhodobacteraceae bacterium]|nr:hypothetical protein [Paracoccaceae bacterium]